jgi:hypothetical protein
MGYNTWNDFRCNGISAANVMKVADAMATMGLSKYGYEVRGLDGMPPLMYWCCVRFMHCITLNFGIRST